VDFTLSGQSFTMSANDVIASSEGTPGGRASAAAPASAFEVRTRVPQSADGSREAVAPLGRAIAPPRSPWAPRHCGDAGLGGRIYRLNPTALEALGDQLDAYWQRA
jgi:hypothetical protein